MKRVYLFSEYLANLGGTEVFHKIHNYWRRAHLGGTDAKAIYNAMPAEVIEKIDAKYDFPMGIAGSGKEEIWVSKMLLDFYLTMLSNPETAKVFSKLDPMTLLYDEINSTDIYGEGRVLIAVKNGSYTIPSDADKGLVYVGLDSNFKPVGDPLFK